MCNKRGVFFLILLVSFLTSCISTNNKYENVIAFSEFSLDKDASKAVIQSMKTELGFHKNTELIVAASASDVDEQIQDIEEFIASNVNVIIVSPIAPKPLKAVLNKAIQKNIPVIILNRDIGDVSYASFIGADNFQVGVNAGKHLISKKKKSTVIEIKSWAGTTPTEYKSLGFQKIIDKNENLRLVGTVQNRYDTPGIKKEFRDLLLANKTVNYVFAHTDALALEAYEVAKELNLERKVKFLGVGGLNSKKGGINLTESGILDATVLYPTGGKEAIKTAISLIEGEKVTKQQLLPSVIIDASNVEVLKSQLGLIQNQELDIHKQQNKIQKQLKLYNSQRSFLIATLLFLLIIAILLTVTFKSRQALLRQKRLLVRLIDKIAVQKREIEKIAEDLRITNEATNNFFTGVSHDFKTPLSLILSSTESLIDQNSKHKPMEFGLIYNNSRRLLKMINQLLDFRRVESKKFKLKASKTNLNNFVKSIFLDFRNEATKKQIKFSYDSTVKNPEVYVDRDLFDNVLFNLLSNAFKFTPNKGEISIRIDENLDSIEIKVKDSGIGILSNEKEKIFSQFFQGTNNKQVSSGVGLYLTKEYIKLHNGTVSVFSEKNKGSEFIINIPKGNKHLKQDEIIITEEIPIQDEIVEVVDNQINTTAIKREARETVLIIEDNSDLREYLVKKLSKIYNTYSSDGIDALDQVTNIIPDVIISDVSLPIKDGFEICEIVKEDEKTSHIPVIILTALNTDEYHIKGLKVGVDLFLTKPFNLSVLIQSIETVLYNRKKIQEFYKGNNQKKKHVLESKGATKEAAFLNKINRLIDENIDNSSFTVEVLAEELNISRVQLYRKIKAILGITISDYIQNVRLEKGKQMLVNNTDLTIADIAYSVGFSSPNYFSTAFKNKFGTTPKKFKKTQ